MLVHSAMKALFFNDHASEHNPQMRMINGGLSQHFCEGSTESIFHAISHIRWLRVYYRHAANAHRRNNSLTMYTCDGIRIVRDWGSLACFDWWVSPQLAHGDGALKLRPRCCDTH